MPLNARQKHRFFQMRKNDPAAARAWRQQQLGVQGGGQAGNQQPQPGGQTGIGSTFGGNGQVQNQPGNTGGSLGGQTGGPATTDQKYLPTNPAQTPQPTQPQPPAQKTMSPGQMKTLMPNPMGNQINLNDPRMTAGHTPLAMGQGSRTTARHVMPGQHPGGGVTGAMNLNDPRMNAQGHRLDAGKGIYNPQTQDLQYNNWQFQARPKTVNPYDPRYIAQSQQNNLDQQRFKTQAEQVNVKDPNLKIDINSTQLNVDPNDPSQFPSITGFERKNYESSPMYQFQMKEGMRALDRQLAAQGLTGSNVDREMKEKFISRLGAEETERARTIAQQEADRMERGLTGNAQRSLTGQTSNADRLASVMMGNANRGLQSGIQNTNIQGQLAGQNASLGTNVNLANAGQMAGLATGNADRDIRAGLQNASVAANLANANSQRSFQGAQQNAGRAANLDTTNANNYTQANLQNANNYFRGAEGNALRTRDTDQANIDRDYRISTNNADRELNANLQNSRIDADFNKTNSANHLATTLANQNAYMQGAGANAARAQGAQTGNADRLANIMTGEANRSERQSNEQFGRYMNYLNLMSQQNPMRYAYEAAGDISGLQNQYGSAMSKYMQQLYNRPTAGGGMGGGGGQPLPQFLPSFPGGPNFAGSDAAGIEAEYGGGVDQGNAWSDIFGSLF